MRVRTSLEIGMSVRARRRVLRWSQGQLAAEIGTSRQWVSSLERGKPSVELHLTLRALNTLGLVITLDAPAARTGDLA